jgi:Bax protein
MAMIKSELQSVLAKSWWLRGLLILCALGAVFVAQADRNPLPDFKQYENVKQKKTAFFDYMLPMVIESNRKTLEQRGKLELLASKADLSAADSKTLSQFASQYGLQPEQDNRELLKKLLLRVDKIPASLALSQAAIESAWGTSRFAVQGNNLFGQWCYKKGCGLVPLRRNSGSNHEVAKFSSVTHSVNAYMRNINTHHAYADLRANRAQLRAASQWEMTGHLLAENLLHYSELREEYVYEVQAVIRINKLAQYD